MEQPNIWFIFGSHNNHPVKVHYTISETIENKTKISATINTDKIQENHVTIMDNKNQRLAYMKQNTKNSVDNEFFDWEVFRDNTQLNVTYKTTKYNDFLTASLRQQKSHHASGVATHDSKSRSITIQRING